MVSNLDYENNKNALLQTSKDARNQLTALCLTLIAAIYFFFDKKIININFAKWAFVFFIATILLEIISSYFKSQHYANVIDGKTNSIDFRESFWGKSSEFIFIFLTPISFTIGVVLFVWGLF